MERTYIMLKPDAYQRRLMGEIISRIEKKGYLITDMKMMHLTAAQLKEHYAHLLDKPFYPDIEKFMMSGPVVGMIVEGEGVVLGMRHLIGATKWYAAAAGTIRGDFANATNLTANLVHGSDSVLKAEEEIARFFGK